MKESSSKESVVRKPEKTKILSGYRPGLEGIIASRSAICHVDGEKGIVEYRGINVHELVRKSTFEETTYLLLYSHLPSIREFSQFKMLMANRTRISGPIRDAIAAFPVGMHPMLALQSAISLLQGDDYYADDTSNNQHNLRRATALIAKIPTLIAACERRRHGEEPLPPVSKYSHAENFLFMLTGEPPDPLASKILDRNLILHAEHSLNNSTFVSRVIGSTNSSIYSAISGAVGSLSGTLHGGANERVLRMLYSIGHPDNVERFVDEQLSSQNRIMGIGHRVYKVKDPRAEILQEFIPGFIKSCSGEGVKKLYKIALRLEEVAKKRLADRKLFPNMDYYSGILLEALGIPIDLFTAVFAMARISGWCAHWLEQVNTNRLFRPTQEYIGDHERPYISIEKR